MKIHRDNLIVALELAIKELSRIEKEAYHFIKDSAFVAGLKDLEDSLIRGEQIEFF